MSEFLWVLVVIAAPVLGTLWVLKRRTGQPQSSSSASANAVYGCMTCGHTRCGEHRFDVHDCNKRLSEGNHPE